ncbi:hypothetical protein ACPA2N_22770 [Ectopseudomonas hydrolytica]
MVEQVATGNTGRSRVSACMPMLVPKEIEALLANDEPSPPSR